MLWFNRFITHDRDFEFTTFCESITSDLQVNTMLINQVNTSLSCLRFWISDLKPDTLSMLLSACHIGLGIV